MTSVPAHGFADDEPTRLLLRSRPPVQASSWVERALGARVLATVPLPGGTSSAVHLVSAQTPGGAAVTAVLRRYVRPELNAEEPDIAAREARTLEHLDGGLVPAPRLLAVDATGEDAGAPAVLMSHLRGAVDWHPTDVDSWLQPLAELLPPLHAQPVPQDLQPFRSYRQESYAPPPWAARRDVWDRAVEVFHRPDPPVPPVFLHRDFHPGNVLWRHGRVTGLVDWQSASAGPVSVDAGHCRANLLQRFGLEVADRFTQLWQRASGETFDPWADVSALVGMLDDGLRDVVPPRPADVEGALARAVAVLHG